MDYTEYEKAIALRYVVEKFGDDITKEDPAGAAMLMEVFIDGLRTQPE